MRVTLKQPLIIKKRHLLKLFLAPSLFLLLEPLIDDDTSISWQTTTDTPTNEFSPTLCKLNQPAVKFVGRSKSQKITGQKKHLGSR